MLNWPGNRVDRTEPCSVLATRYSPRKHKTASLTVSSGRRLLLGTVARLCLNNSRSDEENQLLVLRVDLGVLEQVAQKRQVAE